MSEVPENSGEGNPPVDTTQDPIKNVKAEFNRKLETGLSGINKRLEEVMATLATQRAPAPEVPATAAEPKLSEIAYTDPERFAAIVEERASKKASQIVEQKQVVQQRQNKVISDLVADFPELQNASTPLYQKALELHAQLDQDERSQTSAWKAVVHRAAMELEMKPISKRAPREGSENTDDFVISGSSNSSGARRPDRKKDDIPQATLDFAKLMGRDVSDPKVMEGLKKAAKRKTWNRYR